MAKIELIVSALFYALFTITKSIVFRNEKMKNKNAYLSMFIHYENLLQIILHKVFTKISEGLIIEIRKIFPHFRRF